MLLLKISLSPTTCLLALTKTNFVQAPFTKKSKILGPSSSLNYIGFYSYLSSLFELMTTDTISLLFHKKS